MASKSFTLNTEPHTADIGGVELRFIPEVYGDQFLDSYMAIRGGLTDVQGASADQLDPEQLKTLYAGARTFLADLMADDASREKFAAMRLPDRVLTELLEWVLEVYGSARPTGPSEDSATSQPPTGTRGTAPSRSRA